MKLLSITWSTTPRLPGLRPTDAGKIDCQDPNGAMEGWKLAIRGQQIYFISPAGWTKDRSERRPAKAPVGPCTVFGPMPISCVYLEWKAEAEELEALTKMGKWESEPFGFRPLVVDGDKPILAQIPPGQMGDA